MVEITDRNRVRFQSHDKVLHSLDAHILYFQMKLCTDNTVEFANIHRVDIPAMSIEKDDLYKTND